MSIDESFAEPVSAIYAASIDPVRWPTANFKSIEMYVLPAESDLQNFVKVDQCAIAAH
ncbi:MAG: hypothetical protein WBF89_16930 [Steroidobacteraceae bacterium]